MWPVATGLGSRCRRKYNQNATSRIKREKETERESGREVTVSVKKFTE